MLTLYAGRRSLMKGGHTDLFQKSTGSVSNHGGDILALYQNDHEHNDRSKF